MLVTRPTQKIECCVGVEPADGIEYRYELRSSTGIARRESGWLRAGDPDPGISPAKGETYDQFAIETRRPQHPEEMRRTVRPLNDAAYDIAKDEFVQ
jgi:hypothetical protein